MSGIRATYRTDQGRTVATLHMPAGWQTLDHIEAIARSFAAIHGQAITYTTELHRTAAELHADRVRAILCDSYANEADARDDWRERTA